MAPPAGTRTTWPSCCSAIPSPLDLTFPADPGQLTPVRAALRSWLGRCDVSRRTIQDVLVAAGEACANAIEHGHRDAPGQQIRLRAEATVSQLRLTVTDTGRWRAAPPGGRPAPRARHRADAGPHAAGHHRARPYRHDRRHGRGPHAREPPAPARVPGCAVAAALGRVRTMTTNWPGCSYQDWRRDLRHAARAHPGPGQAGGPARPARAAAPARGAAADRPRLGDRPAARAGRFRVAGRRAGPAHPRGGDRAQRRARRNGSR